MSNDYYELCKVLREKEEEIEGLKYAFMLSNLDKQVIVKCITPLHEALTNLIKVHEILIEEKSIADAKEKEES